MSLTTQSNAYPCSEETCSETFTHGVAGSFCSTRCLDRHNARKQARDILNQLKYDHTICGTCFRVLKKIENPKPDFEFTTRGHAYEVDGDGQTLTYYSQAETREAACGFEYTTENAVSTEKSVKLDDMGRETVVGTGVGCKCGATSHTQISDELRDRFRLEYTYHLVEAIERLQAQDKVDVEIDESILFELSIQSRSFQVALREALL